MFERYAETARRVIFHARHYASQFGCPSIESESLTQAIESRIAYRQDVPPSLDLPVSEDLRRVLEYAAEEADALQHATIDCRHLILGLLRLENCLASTFLRQHGIDYPAYRDTVAGTLRAHLTPRDNPVERAGEWETVEEIASSPSLAASAAALKKHVVGAVKHLDTYSDEYGEQHLKRKPWSRKGALGHLINLATAHHEWIARALTEPGVAAAGYPREEWVFVQKHQEYPWRSQVDLWVAINQLLVHVLTSIPEERVKLPCRIGIEEPKPLLAVVQRYVEGTDDLLGQILSRL